MILTLTTNPAIDRTLRVPVFAVGDVTQVENTTETATGEGVNVTRALLARGYESEALVVCGGLQGTIYQELLNAEGIPATYSLVADNTAVHTTICDESSVSTLKEQGPRISEDELQQLYTTVHRVIDETQAKILVLCGELNPGLSSFFYEKIRRIAVAERIKLAVDTSGFAFRGAIERGGLTVAQASLADLEKFAGVKCEILGEVIEKAWDLLAYNNERILINLGDKGAVLVDEDHAWYATAPETLVKGIAISSATMLAGYLSAMNESAEIALQQAVSWAFSTHDTHATAVTLKIKVTQNPPMDMLLR
ncbi:MAG: PfkB family carbohydrate kinase [Micrococcaceae bacterium]